MSAHTARNTDPLSTDETENMCVIHAPIGVLKHRRTALSKFVVKNFTDNGKPSYFGFFWLFTSFWQVARGWFFELLAK